jgi:hypothetical protein
VNVTRQHFPKIASGEAKRPPYVSLRMAIPSQLVFAALIAVSGKRTGRANASSPTGRALSESCIVDR